ncbi:protein Spindly [Stomoxys calcitrans]|uniref:protein Spindly n=1 Tax=Stomoxys calcitrans TaxID=35570 RepID=UPI0027E2951E|nr:protein Spindly [Stomoxys calcitrans]
MVDYPDILNYTRDELVEEFCKLFDRYQDLREASEADTQKIHELKRSLEVSVAAQTYLSQELEQYTNAENNEQENELQKALNELTELKKRYGKLEASYNALQQDHNTLLEENANLTHNLEEISRRRDVEPLDVTNKTSEEDLQRIQMLENENMDLLQKMEEFQEEIVRYTLAIAECEKNIEILKDQIICLEENLQSKKSDLEEKVQILESTQEQLAEANAQIAMLSSAPESNDRKGNSLFAEVDDQRQVMKQLLASQKKSYLQMKKIYNESEHEIRRLKRENIAMHTELEACSTIFCNADKVYQEKLNQRIRQLVNQNEELERKLKLNQERLKDLASEKSILWLESMLSFCKKETDDLKKQLHSVRLQMACLEEHHRNSQQDLARWRFEALKSRCLLLDREHLLTEHKIDFKPVHAVEFHIPEKQLNEARPRIVSNRRSLTFDNMPRKSTTPLKAIKDENANTVGEHENNGKQGHSKEQLENPPIEKFKVEEIQTQQNSNEVVNNPLEIDKQNSSPGKDTEVPQNPNEVVKKAVEPDNPNFSEEKETEVTQNPHEVIHQAIELHNPISGSEEKENEIPPSVIGKFSKISPQTLSPMRPSQKSLFPKEQDESSTPPARSILSKQRGFLSKESGKSVKFSSQEDIIHSFNPHTPSPTEKSLPSTPATGTSKDEKAGPSATIAANGNSKAVVNQSRTKSNIIVRRVVVRSKHD